MCVDVTSCVEIHWGVEIRPRSDHLRVSLIVGVWVWLAVRGYINLGWWVKDNP